MRRVVLALTASLILASAALVVGPAKAGDYNDDGYYSRRSYSYDRYSDDDWRYRRHYTRHHRDWDDAPSYRRRSYTRYYDDDDYYRPRRRHYYSGYDNGYSSYASSYSNYSYRNCYPGEVKVEDGRGGWVWRVKTVCD